MRVFQSYGQSLVELLIAIGLSALLLPVLLTSLVSSREGRAQEVERLQATALMREMSEAVRQVREKDWSSFAVNGVYYPVASASALSMSPGVESINGFERSATIFDYDLDTSTKMVEYNVGWSGANGGSVTGVEYFSRYLNNLVWSQTSQADFELGTRTSVAVTNNSGGEIILSSGTGASGLQNLGTYNVGGNASGVSVFVSGNYAYVGSVNASTGNNFVIVDVTNPASPTLVSGLNLATNVNGVFVSGNYAYLATANNTRELQVINITNKNAPVLASSLDLGGNQDALSIFVSGSFAFVSKQSATGANRELYIVNISNPLVPVLSGSYEMGSNVNSVFVSGNYAYLATDDNNAELRIINISNPASPVLVGTYNAASGSNGLVVSGMGNTVYLGTQLNGTGAELYLINVTNPASPSLLGSYEYGANVNGVSVSGGYLFLSGDKTLGQLQVLDINNSALPTLLESFDLGAGGNGVFYDTGKVYVGTDSVNAELQIFSYGSSSGYATNGTFESSVFDAGAVVAFNYFGFNVDTPTGTSVSFQLAINNDNSTWNYFGNYSTGSAIPVSSINGRYFRYKATLSGTTTETPTIFDTFVNYSP